MYVYTILLHVLHARILYSKCIAILCIVAADSVTGHSPYVNPTGYQATNTTRTYTVNNQSFCNFRIDSTLLEA